MEYRLNLRHKGLWRKSINQLKNARLKSTDKIAGVSRGSFCSNVVSAVSKKGGVEVTPIVAGIYFLSFVIGYV